MTRKVLGNYKILFSFSQEIFFCSNAHPSNTGRYNSETNNGKFDPADDLNNQHLQNPNLVKYHELLASVRLPKSLKV